MPLSMELLQRLVEASPDIVVATDARGTIAYFNDGARENLGYTREETIGVHVTKFYPSRAEAQRVMAAMRDPAHGERGRVVNFETTFVAKDGHTIPVAISAIIVYGPDGREVGTMGFAKDISEIKRRDQLAVLGEIAIGLSHEINNPLEVIVNQLELLERALLDPRPGQASTLVRLAAIRDEIARIEGQLQRLHEMAEHEDYASTPYVGSARMIDLSRAAAPERERPLSGRRVLVVDDDPGVRESVAEILRGELCDVVGVGDGECAVDELERATFDLVLSDVVMPGMDGYDLFQTTRARWPGTIVVLMTAFYYDKDHIIKRSRIDGLDGVIFKKPIRPDRLRRTLEELFKPPRPDPSSR